MAVSVCYFCMFCRFLSFSRFELHAYLCLNAQGIIMLADIVVGLWFEHVEFIINNK